MRALAILIVPVLALPLVRTAHAGACVSPEEGDEGMAVIESYAKAKSEETEHDYRWLCVELNAVRLRPRIERACRAILDRDGLKSGCTSIAAAAGITQLGKHDLYAWATGDFDDPVRYSIGFSVTKTTMLGRMGDPRGLQVLLDAWKAAIPRAEELEKRHQHQSMMSWSVWRQHAAESIGALGGKDELPFLEEQAKATKDAFVAKACRDAMAAIEKRLAQQAPQPKPAQPPPAKPAQPPATKPQAPAPSQKP